MADRDLVGGYRDLMVSVVYASGEHDGLRCGPRADQRRLRLDALAAAELVAYVDWQHKHTGRRLAA